MFQKILIANRGEIACRIVRTARRMGIATVAVYSEADDGALHMRQADEAVPIGPAPAAQSYLDIERIVRAARDSGAEAVHPGYGFLSENRAFAAALAGADIAFIGPPAEAIAAMGDKIVAKRLAAEAGVDTVPGHPEVIADADEAARIAAKIGYPVMLKASAGGGGKGMRIARDEAEAREGLQLARSEARSSFGDDRVFIEKFIERPRHIEIQVLADRHGTGLHLGERECSIQRRHQKVLEEAPSPFLDAATRAAMGAQAVKLAAAVGYYSAGTVEFIVDRNKNFYFLEMNTRLQVEHPVTELVAGIDLVEQMIRIAAGERLSFGQHDVRLDGWALEARVYAEDPARGFLPSIGRLTRCRPPRETARVRIDTGVEEGSEISLYYDPMIAKLITSGSDRAAAVAAMAQALDAYWIRGISHNIPFLAAVVARPEFRAGDLDTGFIERVFADGYDPLMLDQGQRERLVVVAACMHEIERARAGAGDSALRGWSDDTDPALSVSVGDRTVEATVEREPERFRVTFAGRTHEAVTDWRPGAPLFRGQIDGTGVIVQIDRAPTGLVLSHGGAVVPVSVRRRRAADLAGRMPEKAAADQSKSLLCPMPGLVIAVHVAPGEAVKAGQPLAVVEAMKMENVLRADSDGEVASVEVAAGDSLAVDDVILTFA